MLTMATRQLKTEYGTYRKILLARKTNAKIPADFEASEEYE
jgi:uncharacterized protein YktA (UPF0223 family)